MAQETVPREQSAFLTAKFKLHNPSNRRRALLLDAMRRAHLGYDKLLRKVQPDVEAMVGLETELKREAQRALQTKLQDLARPLPLGAGPKQSVIFDVATQVESYLALKRTDPNTSYPTTPRLVPDPSGYQQSLKDFVVSTDLQSETDLRDELARLRKSGLPRPLNILKNRISDGALLLKDEKGRLFTFINLLPGSAKRRHVVSFAGLIDTRTGEIMSGKSGGGDIFPLECSHWHFEKFINRGTVQSSRLLFDGCDFYFAATFQFAIPLAETSRYLGVDRGIELLAAWSVIDGTGNRLASGMLSGEKLRAVQRREERRQADSQRSGRRYSSRARRAIADEEVHKAANEIAAIAGRYGARVVMEDLTTIAMGPHQARPTGARRVGFRRLLTRAQYMKLKSNVLYRLQLLGHAPIRRGAAPFIEVSPAYTSLTCSRCGHAHKENRQSQALFLCTKCGFKDNADINAATVIAFKGLHFDMVVRGRKKGERLTESEKFGAWLAAMKNGGGKGESLS